MNLMPGKYQFEYNIGNSDIRIYDIFNDGQIQERIAKTNDVHFISTDEAMEKLDIMVEFAKKNKERFKHTSLYDKITKTKLDMLLVIKDFMLDNPVEEDEVRSSW
jgi:hypothetical protein